MSDFDLQGLVQVGISTDRSAHKRIVNDAVAEITRLQSEVERLRGRCGELEARADNCEREARQWRQEARAQSSTVAEIYQELTGKTGEPGDWNGARPLKPAILRKQAEAVEEAYKSTVLSTKGDHPQYEKGFDDAMNQYDGQMEKYVELLRQQADEAEKAGG